MARHLATKVFWIYMFPGKPKLNGSLQRIFESDLSKQELGLARHLATCSFRISKVKEYLCLLYTSDAADE